MNFFQNLFSSNTTEVGRLEVDNISSVVSLLKNLLPSVGMANPPIGSKQSSKGVVVKKKGNKFIITLNQFNPPIEFVWTGSLTDEGLVKAIASIVEKSQIITGITTHKLNNGPVIYQLAVA